MSKRKQILRLMLLTLGALAISSVVQAQDQQTPQEQEPSAKPKPAARGIPAVSEPDTTVEDTQGPTSNWQPDTSPVTGLQVPTIGTPGLAHSYWVPGLEYGSTIQSQPLGQQAYGGGWYATQYVGGALSLMEAWERSQLSVNYSGGGYFTSGGSPQISGQPANGVTTTGGFQSLSLGQSIVTNRWQIQFFDMFSYIPDSIFGFAGGTNLSLPGIGGALTPSIPGLGAAVMPNQSIYSAIGPRYSNVFVPQITYSISRRTSITLGGAYGILRFTEPGDIDSDMALGSAGLNYALNKVDAIGVVYHFTSFHYAGQPQALGSHVVALVYTRKISQRLALSLSGGPQITTFRVPIGTSSHTIGASGGATLSYAVEHGSVNLGYNHGLSGGGGILAGSNADQVTGTLVRQLSRVWSGNVNFGYARNSNILTATGFQATTFNDWFAGGGISRPFGRNINFSVAYSARFERSNLPACTGCTTDYTQNMVSINLQWHTRPFILP